MLVAGAAAVIAAIAIAFVLLSGGPARVPDVVGMSQDKAQAAIEAAGFVMGSIEGTESVAVAEGTVVVQAPEGGTELAEGGSVSIVVAGAPKTAPVPDVKGLNQARAVALIEEAGFEAKVTRRADVFVDKGLVIEQDPVGGAQVLPGSVVTIAISEGPQPKEVEVPDVGGLSRVDAERALRELGLAISVAQAASDDVSLDVVISQLPKAGEKLLEGSRVGIVVSSGPPTAEAVVVPDVVGATLANAEQALADAGFQAVPTGEKAKGKPANQVTRQVPAAGAKAQPGSSVVIFYASE
jgi:serine/threonine-protein kinase